jgi:hypothetical protein
VSQGCGASMGECDGDSLIHFWVLNGQHVFFKETPLTMTLVGLGTPGDEGASVTTGSSVAG